MEKMRLEVTQCEQDVFIAEVKKRPFREDEHLHVSPLRFMSAFESDTAAQISRHPFTVCIFVY